jgi:hypothetical protein
LYEYFARVGGYPNNKRTDGEGLGRGIDKDIPVSAVTVEFVNKMENTTVSGEENVIGVVEKEIKVEGGGSFDELHFQV